ncbi:helix-turn-helix domain-containing protein, partial [Streptomyces sp. NPDC057052]|uniref:helix-turn-helix domain-containing protein n=1 Tax=Streptomyces sp. NPDC057052 TaxID=3346010 RepID=UPI00363D5646
MTRMASPSAAVAGRTRTTSRFSYIVTMSNIVDPLVERIAVRVRAERERRGWTLNELAEASGVSRAMIHRIERGESSPTAV